MFQNFSELPSHPWHPGIFETVNVSKLSIKTSDGFDVSPNFCSMFLAKRSGRVLGPQGRVQWDFITAGRATLGNAINLKAQPNMAGRGRAGRGSWRGRWLAITHTSRAVPEAGTGRPASGSIPILSACPSLMNILRTPWRPRPHLTHTGPRVRVLGLESLALELGRAGENKHRRTTQGQT